MNRIKSEKSHSPGGSEPPGADAVIATNRRWALLRFALGQAQVIGATLALVLLLSQGASSLVILIMVLTGLITMISLLLFRVSSRNRSPKR